MNALRHAVYYALAALAAAAQIPSRVAITGGSIRVEVAVANGKLQERYLARDGSSWAEIAVSAGRSAGPLTLIGPAGALIKASVASLSAEGRMLVEEFASGGLRVRRSLSFEGAGGNGPWLRIVTRLEGGLPIELHSFSDQFRTNIPPGWTFSPAVGGFNPDSTYKAPLILMQSARRAAGIVPDTASLSREVLQRCNHAIDLDAPAGLFTVGFVPARQAYHSVYREDLDRQWLAQEPIENSYFLYLSAVAPPEAAFRDAVRFHWRRLAPPELAIAAAAQAGTAANYKSSRLWDEWRRTVWNEESTKNWLSVPLPGGSSGGAVRTIRWGGPAPSVYLSAWFNSMRTGYGMALYARRTGNAELLNLARQTVQLALKAPGRDGAFKCVALPRNSDVQWAAGDGAGNSVVSGFLGFDMSWTAYWLLRWRESGLSSGSPGDDAAIIERGTRLADFLIARQARNGMLPTRFAEDGAVQQELSETVKAETGSVALFLLALHKAAPKPEYLRAAREGLSFLDREVAAQRKWYDFETFWSCSPRFVSFDERTRQWPANNLALIHTVHAYLSAYNVTKERSYLDKGQLLLDYLLLYQQSWTNPVLEGLTSPAMLLGGFTTQNSDAEWSDARQSLAGNVLLDYYRATGDPEYLERGVQALRSQFPVSPSENWAHRGYGPKAGVSSFHWGSGSGMAGIEIEEDYLRDAVFDVLSARGVGVNGLNLTAPSVEGSRIQFRLESPFSWNRDPVVVFRRTQAGHNYEVIVNDRSLGTHAAKTLEVGLAIPIGPR